jgi:ParB-like chromosome segregation protein Spo0J
MHGNNLPAPAGQAAPPGALAFNWRAHLRVHPAAEFFPLLSETDPAAFEALVEDIKVNGLIEPIVFCDDLLLLDGQNRLDALAQLGRLEVDDRARLLINSVNVAGDPYAIALSLNVHRRHLNAEQKRELIANVLKAKPEKSNNQIAKEVKADDKTVAKVRADLESTSEIPKLEKTVGADGKARKRRKESHAQSHHAAAAERGKQAWAALTARWIKDHPGQTADDFDRVSSCSASDAEAEEYGRWMAPFFEQQARKQPSPEEVRERSKRRAAKKAAAPVETMNDAEPEAMPASVAPENVEVGAEPEAKPNSIDVNASQVALEKFQVACDDWFLETAGDDRQAAIAYFCEVAGMPAVNGGGAKPKYDKAATNLLRKGLGTRRPAEQILALIQLNKLLDGRGLSRDAVLVAINGGVVS